VARNRGRDLLVTSIHRRLSESGFLATEMKLLGVSDPLTGTVWQSGRPPGPEPAAWQSPSPTVGQQRLSLRLVRRAGEPQALSQAARMLPVIIVKGRSSH
jgi:hypothetical protein